MKNVLNLVMVAAMLALAATPGAISHASDRSRLRGSDDRHDHERARRALQAGEARPLVEIFAEVGDRLGGRIVGVEFERKDKRHVYEFKVITPSGTLRQVYVDAMTAEIIETEED